MDAQPTARAGCGAPSLEELITDVRGIVTPPIICARLYGLIQSERSTVQEIGELVSVEPNLTARLLKIVNSAFFGLNGRVQSVARAVTILGTQELYNIALAISAVRAFSRLGAGLVPLERYWRHSVLTGVLARNLARKGGLPQPERSFVAGLLHDVGSPAIFTRVPHLAHTIDVSNEQALHAAEQTLLGYTHADVGARLLESWQLPIEISEAIASHHEPFAAQGVTEPEVLKLAEALANAAPDFAFFAVGEKPGPTGPAELLIDRTRTVVGDDPEVILAEGIRDTGNLLDSLLGAI